MVVRFRIVIAFLMFVCISQVAVAQVVNPADKQTPPPPPEPLQASEHVPTWRMPAIDVYGRAPLVEEDRIGDYAQPRWTAHRRFGETRVYVIPKGMIEFEYWLTPETPKGGPTQWGSQYEFEFGLPKRFQLDLYAVAHKTGNNDSLKIDEQKVELRYAFADWGKIPFNPTVYVEWKQEASAPDHAEVKMLFGGQIAPRWHWGSNLVWEHEMGGPQENSNEWTTGLSYSLRDSKVSVGVETQMALVNERIAPGMRTPFSKEFVVGPSLQFRPLPQMHLDIAPMFGATTNSLRAKSFFVLGWEF
jgi:hypothetical protein